ncbi:hypothetical protein P4O66_001358 [Electrophorus voltai]|uniref:Uncharacterized protein n=1 Tax=Electrophorus voltai TaxID=2609070 RepID=A0AAD9DUP5_9TELE|nr:hypothetical protein P4O66_001358 [Electrophorus voltai]
MEDTKTFHKKFQHNNFTPYFSTKRETTSPALEPVGGLSEALSSVRQVTSPSPRRSISVPYCTLKSSTAVSPQEDAAQPVPASDVENPVHPEPCPGMEDATHPEPDLGPVPGIMDAAHPVTRSLPVAKHLGLSEPLPLVTAATPKDLSLIAVPPDPRSLVAAATPADPPLTVTSPDPPLTAVLLYLPYNIAAVQSSPASTVVNPPFNSPVSKKAAMGGLPEMPKTPLLPEAVLSAPSPPPAPVMSPVPLLFPPTSHDPCSCPGVYCNVPKVTNAARICDLTPSQQAEQCKEELESSFAFVKLIFGLWDYGWAEKSAVRDPRGKNITGAYGSAAGTT